MNRQGQREGGCFSADLVPTEEDLKWKAEAKAADMKANAAVLVSNSGAPRRAENTAGPQHTRGK